MKPDPETEEDIEEYIYRKRNGICVLCDNGMLYDSEAKEYYCAVCDC